MVVNSSGRVFDDLFYKGVTTKASEYARETMPIDIVPILPIDKLDAKEFKKPIMGASTGVKGEDNYSLPDRKMDTPITSKTFKLLATKADLYYDINDMALDRELLIQKQNEQIMEWSRQAMISLWKGVYTGGFSASAGAAPIGTRLNDGFLASTDSYTLVEDLNGVDSQLDAAGDVYAALQKMLSSMPARYMQRANLTLGMTTGFAIKARGTSFIGDQYLNGEYDLFIQQYGANGKTPLIKNVVVSDDLFLGATDTLGTNDRLVLYSNDSNVLEGVFSRGFTILGEERNSIGGVTQSWATRSCGCVYQPTAVLYSEPITW